MIVREIICYQLKLINWRVTKTSYVTESVQE